MSHLPMYVGRECHWRPREPHTSPRAKGPRAGVRLPRSPISTHALHTWVGVSHTPSDQLSLILQGELPPCGSNMNDISEKMALKRMMTRLGERTLPELEVGLNPFDLADLARNPHFKATSVRIGYHSEYVVDLSFQMGDGLCSKEIFTPWAGYPRSTCISAALKAEKDYDEFLTDIAGDGWFLFPRGLN